MAASAGHSSDGAGPPSPVMSAQAHSLHDAVGRLKVLVGGGAESGSAAQVHRTPVKAKAAPRFAAAARKPASHAPAAKASFPMDGDFSDF